MARYDAGNGRYGGDYRDAGYPGGGFADGGSYYGDGDGGGGYYAGAGDWYGGYDTPQYDRDYRGYRGYRGRGTDLGEDIRRGYVGRDLYTRAAVGPGSRGFHEYEFPRGYGLGRYPDSERDRGGHPRRRYGRGEYSVRPGWHR